MNPLPPHLQGWGPLAPQSPIPYAFPPEPPRTHVEPRLMGAAPAAEKHGGQRGNADGTARMAAAEAAGNLTRKLRTQPASFSVPGLFLNKACRAPFFHLPCGAGGVAGRVVEGTERAALRWLGPAGLARGQAPCVLGVALPPGSALPRGEAPCL